MARLVVHDVKAPAAVKAGDKTVMVCRCGLTKKKDGTCDGSHIQTQDEKKDKLYTYDKELNRYEVEEEEECECGDDCECHEEK